VPNHEEQRLFLGRRGQLLYRFGDQSVSPRETVALRIGEGFQAKVGVLQPAHIVRLLGGVYFSANGYVRAAVIPVQIVLITLNKRAFALVDIPCGVIAAAGVDRMHITIGSCFVSGRGAQCVVGLLSRFTG